MTDTQNDAALSAEAKDHLESRMERAEQQGLQNSSDIGALRAIVETTATNLDKLERRQEIEHAETRKTMTDGFDRLGKHIEARQANAGPILIGTLSLVLVCVGGFATFVILTVQPIRARGEHTEARLEQRLDQLPDDYYQFGRNSMQLQTLQDQFDGLRADVDRQAETCAHTRGKVVATVEAMDDQLQRVDRWGSRTGGDQ